MRQGLPEPIVLETCELWGTYMRFIAAAEVVSYDTNLARRVTSDAPSQLEDRYFEGASLTTGAGALVSPRTRPLPVSTRRAAETASRLPSLIVIASR